MKIVARGRKVFRGKEGKQFSRRPICKCVEEELRRLMLSTDGFPALQ